MAFITVWKNEETDKDFGHCSECMSYNNINKKDYYTKCSACQRKMWHIKPGLIVGLVIFIGLISILIFNS